MLEEELLLTADDLRPHKQCPRETKNNGQWFQTEDSVKTLVEVDRLPQRAQLGTETQVLLTHRACRAIILSAIGAARQNQANHDASTTSHN